MYMCAYVRVCVLACLITQKDFQVKLNRGHLYGNSAPVGAPHDIPHVIKSLQVWEARISSGSKLKLNGYNYILGLFFHYKRGFLIRASQHVASRGTSAGKLQSNIVLVVFISQPWNGFNVVNSVWSK